MVSELVKKVSEGGRWVSGLRKEVGDGGRRVSWLSKKVNEEVHWDDGGRMGNEWMMDECE